jgi:hypothetical protein
MILMVIRPSKDVLESLRVTLQKLEHGLDPTHDASAMAELKRMVLLRIAELEAVEALQHAVVETAGSSGLPPHLAVTEGVPGKETVDSTQRKDRSQQIAFEESAWTR